MENRGRGRLRGVAVLAALAAVAVTAAVWTGSAAAGQKTAAAGTNPFAHYGNITLNVWTADNQDPGPKPVIEALAKSFRNLARVSVLTAEAACVADIVSAATLVASQAAIDALTARGKAAAKRARPQAGGEAPAETGASA